MSSAEAPSAAVRTITPPSFTSRLLRISRRRVRSASSSRRETPSPAPLGPLEIDLGDTVVLEHGDALLADVDGDHELALRGRERRAPRGRLAPRGALLARGRAPLGSRLVLLRGLRLGFGLCLGLDLGRRAGGGRALPAAPTPATAAAALAGCGLALGFCRARLSGRLAY